MISKVDTVYIVVFVYLVYKVDIDPVGLELVKKPKHIMCFWLDVFKIYINNNILKFHLTKWRSLSCPSNLAFTKENTKGNKYLIWFGWLDSINSNNLLKGSTLKTKPILLNLINSFQAPRFLVILSYKIIPPCMFFIFSQPWDLKR